jgi:hypothetical protein
MDRRTMSDNTTDDDGSPRAPLEADLEIPGVRTLYGKERERVLTLPQAGTVSEFCGRAGIRCSVTGGPEARVVFWDGPEHGITSNSNYEKNEQALCQIHDKSIRNSNYEISNICSYFIVLYHALPGELAMI